LKAYDVIPEIVDQRLHEDVGLELGQQLPICQIRNRKFVDRFLNSCYGTSPTQFLLFGPGVRGQVNRIRTSLN
jgi:hypothetical protein